MTTKDKAFKIAQQNANQYNHTRIVYRDEFVGAIPGNDYFETEAQSFYADAEYENCDPIAEVDPDPDLDSTPQNDDYVPYSEWDIEHLHREKLAIQESLKHHPTLELQNTLNDINSAFDQISESAIA